MSTLEATAVKRILRLSALLLLNRARPRRLAEDLQALALPSLRTLDEAAALAICESVLQKRERMRCALAVRLFAARQVNDRMVTTNRVALTRWRVRRS